MTCFLSKCGAGPGAASGCCQVLDLITVPQTSQGAVSVMLVWDCLQRDPRYLSNFTSLSLQPVALGCNLFEGRPQLTAWRERVEAFLGAELCQEAHSPILSVLGQAAKKTLPVPPPEAHASMMLRIARIP